MLRLHPTISVVGCVGRPPSGSRTGMRSWLCPPRLTCKPRLRAVWVRVAAAAPLQAFDLSCGWTTKPPYCMTLYCTVYQRNIGLHVRRPGSLFTGHLSWVSPSRCCRSRGLRVQWTVHVRVPGLDTDRPHHAALLDAHGASHVRSCR